MSKLRQVTDSIWVDDSGRTWMAACDALAVAAEAANAVENRCLHEWRTREKEWSDNAKALDDHLNELKDELWKAQQEAARNNRAEDAMRDYEQMIGDLKTENEKLKRKAETADRDADSACAA